MPKSLFEASCKGKIKYETEEYAKKCGRDLFRKKGRILSAYQCKYGNHWHLGKPQPRGPLDFIRGLKEKEWPSPFGKEGT